MIETERTLSIPLNFILLTAYLKNDGTLERLLGLKKSDYVIPEEIKEDLKKHILPAILFEKTENVFKTIWIIQEKKEKVILGSFSFKGVPKANGDVEVGYGIERSFRQKGFMKEVLNGIILYGQLNLKIKRILAEIAIDNHASLALVAGLNFQNIKKKSANSWWAYTY